jgi:hypothetical protein
LLPRTSGLPKAHASANFRPPLPGFEP